MIPASMRLLVHVHSVPIERNGRGEEESWGEGQAEVVVWSFKVKERVARVCVLGLGRIAQSRDIITLKEQYDYINP